ncbi:MAG: hypothetical protein IT578_00485 [Verrucomicrobiae bacterium]|nr:hypothetical protein [Verrucomicrobiae bacterium]
MASGRSASPSSRALLVAALVLWASASLLRLSHFEGCSGLSYDDAAYATSGKEMIEEGHGYWGDCWRPFASWWVAALHLLRGVDVANTGLAFTLLRSFGELWLILAVRWFFPASPWAPLGVAAVSACSFLGVNYGRQHLSSLLFTIPLALLAYANFLRRGGWSRWAMCGFAAGLVFLSHFNTIAALAIMLALEGLRRWLSERRIGRVAVCLLIGAGVAYATVGLLGLLSYGGNWKRYFKLVGNHMMENQVRGRGIHWAGLDPSLLAAASWEGALLLLYLAALAWGVRGIVVDRGERDRLLAVVGVPLLGGLLVAARASAGMLSFPRLYVFVLPFLWLLLGGAVGRVAERAASAGGARRGWVMAILLFAGALAVQGGHLAMAARTDSANAALGRWLRAHPTKKMAIYAGTPHLPPVFFGWRSQPPADTREQSDRFWHVGGAAQADHVPAHLADPSRRVYLQRPDLPEVCDLVVLHKPSARTLAHVEAALRTTAPGAFTTNFYDGTSLSLPLAADEGGALLGPLIVPDAGDSPLPMVRVWDLRGTRR